MSSIFRVILLRALICFFAVYTYPLSAAELIGVYADNASIEDQHDAQAIVAAIAAIHHDNFRIEPASSIANKKDATDRILIALGPEALEELLSGNGDIPILALYSNYSRYQILSNRYRTTRRLTGVFSNPDPRRQLALIRTLYGASTRVAILSGSADESLRELQESFAASIGLTVSIVIPEQGIDVRALISQFVDANAIYIERSSASEYHIPIDQLLLLAYEWNHIGVIGYSPAVVKIGGLATTYSTDEDFFREAADLISSLRSSKKVPPARFPTSYHVSLNSYLSRTLNIPAANEELLARQIEQLLHTSNQKNERLEP